MGKIFAFFFFSCWYPFSSGYFVPSSPPMDQVLIALRPSSRDQQPNCSLCSYTFFSQISSGLDVFFTLSSPTSQNRFPFEPALPFTALQRIRGLSSPPAEVCDFPPFQYLFLIFPRQFFPRLPPWSSKQCACSRFLASGPMLGLFFFQLVIPDWAQSRRAF